MIKKYENYLIKLFFKNILLISIVFIFISFFLNIFEEIKFADNYDKGFLYPVMLTLLNIPSIVFEILPFIFLISSMFFYIDLYDKEEIELLRTNGINNSKITFVIAVTSIMLGAFLIIIFYSLSANLKNIYLNLKYKYTENSDHLAVVNESGLWIKEKISNSIFIINANSFNKNDLENISITQLDSNYKAINTIISKYANIEKRKWILNDVKIFSEKSKNNINYKQYTYVSSFNGEIISNLYSNLNSLNIIELHKLKKNYNSIGYSTTEVKLHLNKLYSLPIYLTLTTIIGSLLMFRLNYIKSKFFLVMIGVLVSVVFYYINYFSVLFGKNETFPVEISVWMPQLMILLICSLGLLRLNES
jgi:lipopolysaccharide export system permease protein